MTDNIDYNYLHHLITVLQDAPVAEKQRFLRVLISYLLTFL